MSYFEFTQRDLDEAVSEYRVTVEGLTNENTDLGKQLDRATEKVRQAVSDLESIGDVPLRDLIGYVDAVIKTLKAADL